MTLFFFLGLIASILMQVFSGGAWALLVPLLLVGMIISGEEAEFKRKYAPFQPVRAVAKPRNPSVAGDRIAFFIWTVGIVALTVIACMAVL